MEFLGILIVLILIITIWEFAVEDLFNDARDKIVNTYKDYKKLYDQIIGKK